MMRIESQSATAKHLSSSAHFAKRIAKRWFVYALGLAVAAMVAAPAAQAQTFDVVYSFTAYTDGALPYAQLIVRDGSLYGTTQLGGRPNWGTVFTVNNRGAEAVLHRFTIPDGSLPTAGLVMDSAGNIYGTAAQGGYLSCDSPLGCGTIFKLDTGGTYTVLHTFAGLAKGFGPLAGLITDSAGNLYGTTWLGGNLKCNIPYRGFGCGVVFKLDASGTYTVVHAFNGEDGATPLYGPLVMDSAGNLYGTTSNGGAYGNGTVFELDPKGIETVLYSFKGGRDGAFPYAGLFRDEKGNLYGTTYHGGEPGKCLNVGCGVVFKVDSSGTETVLYRSNGGMDGEWPESSLIRDSQGNLYGTTYYGGDPSCDNGGIVGCGTVFKVDASGTETFLHRFNPSTDGENPVAGLVMDSKGILYGTALNGGKGYGTVFRLTP